LLISRGKSVDAPIETVHGMIPLNPISGAALPGAIAQQQLATDKTRHIRRQQAARRNIAAAEDNHLHTVENAEAVTPVKDEGQRQQKERRPSHHAPQDDAESDQEEPPHLDVVG
jgi:hypothetical protein